MADERADEIESLKLGIKEVDGLITQIISMWNDEWSIVTRRGENWVVQNSAFYFKINENFPFPRKGSTSFSRVNITPLVKQLRESLADADAICEKVSTIYETVEFPALNDPPLLAVTCLQKQRTVLEHFEHIGTFRKLLGMHFELDDVDSVCRQLDRLKRSLTDDDPVQKGHPKKRGRPKEYDHNQDRKIAAAWKSGKGAFRTKAELAVNLGMEEADVKKALERHRKKAIE